MKSNISVITRFVVTYYLLVQTLLVGAEIKNSNMAATLPPLLSNDVQSVIIFLPEIEKLWPEHPQTYFQSINQAAHILGGGSNHPAARQALLNLFTNMIQKPCPTNIMLAVPCIEEKCSAVLYFLNFDDVRNDKLKWVAIAKLIGDIRAQIIPDFTRQPVYSLNVLGLSQQEHEKAVAENERNKAINAFQKTLRATNTKLTFHLLHNINRMAGTSGTDFIQDIISSAHLNEEERQQLK